MCYANRAEVEFDAALLEPEIDGLEKNIMNAMETDVVDVE